MVTVKEMLNMKILLDENVPMSFQKDLKNKGYSDILSINNFKKGLPDNKVFDVAFEQERIIVTIDRDFHEYKRADSFGIISLSGKLNDKCNMLIKTIEQVQKDERLPNDFKNCFIRVTNMYYEIIYKKKNKYKETKFKFK